MFFILYLTYLKDAINITVRSIVEDITPLLSVLEHHREQKHCQAQFP